MTDRDVHVVFGTAALGQAIMRQLLAAGKAVRMVSRSGKLDAPAGVTVVRADAANAAEAVAASKDAAVLYHTAAPDYTKWAELYPAIQRGVIAAAAASGARLVSAESVYGYGPVNGPMTEDLPYAPTTRKGKIRVEMSKLLMDAHAAGQIKAAIARAPTSTAPRRRRPPSTATACSTRRSPARRCR
jgi:nucleoside-diphosphate-sugar epimerase